MYSPLVYVAEGDAAWVDSGKEKTSYKSLPGMSIILVWNDSVTYYLLFLRLKQDVFLRYCAILYVHFCFLHTYFFKKRYFASPILSASIYFLPAVSSRSPPAPRFLRVMRWARQSIQPLGTLCRNTGVKN